MNFQPESLAYFIQCLKFTFSTKILISTVSVLREVSTTLLRPLFQILVYWSRSIIEVQFWVEVKFGQKSITDA